MNNKAPERIPTLTDIVETGDPSMKDHFDGRFIDDIKQNEKSDITTEELDPQTINVLVNEVIHTTMPIIERQLRNQLSRILKKYQHKP